jgi:hypothetical protein
MKRIPAALAAIACVLAVSSCASSPTAFDPATRGKSIDCKIVLVPLADGAGGTFTLAGAFPERTVIEGSYARESSGDIALETGSLRWFSNWKDGWTEARFDLPGKLRLTRTGGAWSLAVVELPSLGMPTEAGIRYRDTVLSRDAALRQMANRWDRIVATSALLRKADIYAIGKEGYPTLGEDKEKKAGRSFRIATARYLFPEVAGWPTAELKDKYRKAETTLADDIRWSKAYSRDAFPEEFRAIRDSGTLFRDWEEASALFYLACWNGEIFARLARDAKVAILEKRKEL